MQQYVWLICSSFALVIWAIIFFSLRNSGEKQKEMLAFSLWISLFGLTQPLWVPEYWHPPSLFNLRSEFDIESIIYSFALGGIVVAVYRCLFPAIVKPVKKHKYQLLSFFSVPVVFVFLLAAFKLNNMYSIIFAMAIGGLFSYFLRPDLRKRMFACAGGCTVMHFGFFLLLMAMFPGYVERFWNLNVLWGIFILGVPLEELVFAVFLGFLWPSIYEYVREQAFYIKTKKD